MKKLPGVVTFAFQPYGTDLHKQVMRARAEGYEVLAQIPMEPFEPDHDPGRRRCSPRSPRTRTSTACTGR